MHGDSPLVKRNPWAAQVDENLRRDENFTMDHSVCQLPLAMLRNMPQR
jgi:hypothetical protein